jgi:hypothetical protein
MPNLELRCCHFCGESSCFVCCKSQRPFPQAMAFNDQREEGRLCRLCDRKFMMYLYQENKVEPVLDRVEDIEGLLATYQMRVQEA